MTSHYAIGREVTSCLVLAVSVCAVMLFVVVVLIVVAVLIVAGVLCLSEGRESSQVIRAG